MKQTEIKDTKQEELTYDITHVSLALSERLLKSTNQNGDVSQNASLMAKAIMEDLGSNEWSGPDGYQNFLFDGVYSPMQLLVNYIANQETSAPDRDYPFLFGTIGKILSILTDENYNINESKANDYRKLVQTIFQMREITEEGENLSLETYLPSSTNDNDSEQILELKKLGQIFGRGTAVVKPEGLSRRIEVKGNVFDIFKSHDGAPSSLVYTLGQAYSHVPKSRVSIALRRDRTIIISKKYNPLLEFYDGGWHIVDMTSAREALNECFALDPDLSAHVKKSKITDPLIKLAYYMASHYHSGILAVIDYDKAIGENVLEDQIDWSLNSTKIILDQLGRNHVSTFRITEIEDTKYGRVLLTNVLQDGATIFKADGTFHSAGRVVTNFSKKGKLGDSKSGTGNRAAQRLSEFGIALKISKDGAIKLYSGLPKDNDHLNKGLRIR